MQDGDISRTPHQEDMMQFYPHHPSGEGANRPLRELARAHGILPHRCARCGQRHGDWNRDQDDSSDPQWLGFQCGGCGAAQGLSRGQVLRRIRQSARAAGGTDD